MSGGTRSKGREVADQLELLLIGSLRLVGIVRVFTKLAQLKLRVLVEQSIEEVRCLCDQHSIATGFDVLHVLQELLKVAVAHTSGGDIRFDAEMLFDPADAIERVIDLLRQSTDVVDLAG